MVPTDDRPAVAATPSLTTATGGAFDQELRDLLLQRTRLMLWIVLAVASVAFLVNTLLVRLPPAIQGGLVPHEAKLRLIQIASFVVGLLLTYVLKKSARQLQLLAFWIIAVNIVAAMFLLASIQPDEEPYLVVALTLFVYAAFIPSPARFPIMLGATAVASFILSATLTYAFVPLVQVFWEQLGGISLLGDHLILGTTGITILAVVAHVASRTLYSLRVRTHEASRLGNYIVEQELGSGGMGQVFRARHALIRRPTAVKVMQASGEEELAAIKRFEREVQLSATLTHPNTITIYDFGRTPDNRFYYAMEYLDGLDLQQLVERFGPMDGARAAYVMAQACSALSEAHERDIIHRDIKPSNIFLTHRGGLYDFVKVLDFGLAKLLMPDEAVSITRTGIAVGTPRYISPEAVQGSDSIDGRSDLYCLGAVAYFTITGRPPFDSSSSVELLIDHMKATPVRPSRVCELPVHPELDDIIMRCLEKKPEDRFQSAGGLEAALQAIPFEESWTREKAREWWDLHGLAAAPAGGAAPEPGDQRPSSRGISEFIYEP